MHVGIFLKHASATKIDVNRDIDLSRCNISVKKPFATGGAAQTRNSVIAVPFSFEFIVVREFFICGSVNNHVKLYYQTMIIFGELASFNIPQSVYNNSFAAIDFYDFGGTIRSAAVIDEPGDATSFRCIDNRVLIDSEKITAADSAFQISPLSHVCNLLPHFFADVFDNHIIGRDIFFRVESPVVNSRPSKSNRLFPFLKLIKAEDITFTTLQGEGLFLCVDICDQSPIIDSR